ncbi:MAG: hypothetical protein EBY18_20120 [Alphaproteobacteria bacterium]|nr:hypothetical protein [Alphaproteobacteria bacterium]
MPYSEPLPPGGYPDIRWHVPPKRPSPARRKRDFLRHLLRWGSMSEAAARTGIDRRTAHRWRAEDEAFDQACRERLKWRRETILLAAMDRVRNPKTRPVLYRGRQIGHIGRANDRIVAALMWSAEIQGRAK